MTIRRLGLLALVLALSGLGAAGFRQSPPTADSITVLVTAGETVAIPFSAFDPDGDLICFMITSNPSPATAGTLATSCVCLRLPPGVDACVCGSSFTASSTFSGTAWFTYRAVDSTGLQSADVYVTINVVPAPIEIDLDLPTAAEINRARFLVNALPSNTGALLSHLDDTVRFLGQNKLNQAFNAADAFRKVLGPAAFATGEAAAPAARALHLFFMDQFYAPIRDRTSVFQDAFGFKADLPTAGLVLLAQSVSHMYEFYIDQTMKRIAQASGATKTGLELLLDGLKSAQGAEVSIALQLAGDEERREEAKDAIDKALTKLTYWKDVPGLVHDVFSVSFDVLSEVIHAFKSLKELLEAKAMVEKDDALKKKLGELVKAIGDQLAILENPASTPQQKEAAAKALRDLKAELEKLR